MGDFCLSVRPSVRPSVGLYNADVMSKQLYISSKPFSPSGKASIPVFNPNGVKSRKKNLQFSTNVADYLENGTR